MNDKLRFTLSIINLVVFIYTLFYIVLKIPNPDWWYIPSILCWAILSMGFFGYSISEL